MLAERAADLDKVSNEVSAIVLSGAETLHTHARDIETKAENSASGVERMHGVLSTQMQMLSEVSEKVEQKTTKS